MADKRPGAKWEAWGFVLILLGFVLMMTKYLEAAGALFVVGFVVFLIGRFK